MQMSKNSWLLACDANGKCYRLGAKVIAVMCFRFSTNLFTELTVHAYKIMFTHLKYWVNTILFITLLSCTKWRFESRFMLCYACTHTVSCKQSFWDSDVMLQQSLFLPDGMQSYVSNNVATANHNHTKILQATNLHSLVLLIYRKGLQQCSIHTTEHECMWRFPFLATHKHHPIVKKGLKSNLGG